MPTATPRLISLRGVFTKPNMLRAWKRTVRNGLRGQAFGDLHDYLDVHRNIGAFVWRLRADVVTGRYRPAEPTVVRLEKRLGIDRRLMLPAPADALVLQTIVDVIEPRLLRREPTQNAYYARSHMPRSVKDVDLTFPYPWWQLWPQFQQRVWNFTSAQPFVVVTDVASYFDSIPLYSLRDTVASLARIEQPVLDLLFYLLEAFVWRPDYIPFSGVGLPQIDFDAPRLLAHCYLYPVDELIAKRIPGEYVRWMDDINFGVPSETQGREILGRIDTRLNMLGVRLNTGKTKILDAPSARDHFRIQENRQLNIFTNSLRYGAKTPRAHTAVRALLRNRFATFWIGDRSGAWSKVLKRYYTAFGKLGDQSLETHTPEVLRQHPDVRSSVFRYYLALGYSPARFRQVDQFLRTDCTDDSSLFEACQLIVHWHVPARSPLRTQVMNLANWLRRTKRNQISAIAGGLWLVVKYGSETQLWGYLKSSRHVWQRSGWAVRQAAAVYPRLNGKRRRQVEQWCAEAGMVEGLQIISSMKNLEQLTRLDNQLRSYLEYTPAPPYPYAPSKVMLLKLLQQGDLRAADKVRLSRITVTDSVYKEVLA
jgi:hypothetical protein